MTVYPTSRTLRVIQDKLLQKQAMQQAGLPVPQFVAVEGVGEVAQAADRLGYPLVLKARYG
ncbi:MAG: ATP-grasp domain-containing protein, partial [Anaerolineae bacterium]|nr:ATP-grasp domain-containing protein [Anaerolineae bacterium]